MKLEIVKTADSTNVYELVLNDDLYVVESSVDRFELSIAACETECCYEVLVRARQVVRPLKRKYPGLKEMYEAICAYEKVAPVGDYSTVYKINDGHALHTLVEM